uniref:SVP1-like protein 2 n=1 Tax=Lygus hesperus TaxID=30085 RepID=A0A0A9X9X6_LYGHE
MAFNLQAKLAECALFTLMLSLTVGHQSSVKRVEIDLLRLMDGNFAPTTLSTTLTLDNGTAIAVFSGDNLSYQIDSRTTLEPWYQNPGRSCLIQLFTFELTVKT